MTVSSGYITLQRYVNIHLYEVFTQRGQFDLFPLHAVQPYMNLGSLCVSQLHCRMGLTSLHTRPWHTGV